jgi:hypothetical protein
MAGAPLGTRTAAKQSESKSKLMPNLFESRGLRRLWASHGLPLPNPVRSGLPTNQELTTMAGIRTQPYCYFERSFSLHRTAGSISCRALSIKLWNERSSQLGMNRNWGWQSRELGR